MAKAKIIKIDEKKIKKLDLAEYYVKENFYKNKYGLRGEDVELELTDEQIREIIKCRDDIVYFLSNYVYIIHPDEGKILFNPREFQKEIINLINTEKNIMSMVARQSGKSIVIGGYTLHYILFNSDKVVDIVSNKEGSAKKLLKKIKDMYKDLPMFLQAGIIEWNKTSIELDNGSKVMVEATTEDAGTGDTVNLFICDEFAKVPKNIADDFIKSVLPTLSAGKTQKLVIITTPKGMNFFYRMWKKEETSKNPEYVLYKKDWKANPERDEIWEKKERRKLGDSGFEQEYNCVAGDTIITVKEKYTEYIYDIEISKIKELIKYNKYLIKTPNGFEDFYEISEVTKNKYIEVIFKNDVSIKCSYNHKFINSSNEEVFAEKLEEGDLILSETGEVEVREVIKCKGNITLYDLVNVGKNSLYYTNKILSHNCSFLGSDKSLFRGDVLQQIEICDPIKNHPLSKEIDDLEIYEDVISNGKYVMTVDCASGLAEKNGKSADSSSISVLKILKDSFVQVARFNSPHINEVGLAEIISIIGTYYNYAYALVEVNNMGIAVVDNLMFTEEYENVIDLNPDKYIGGILSTAKTNRIGNRVLKKLVNNGILVIKSGDTIEQASNYVLKGKDSYAGADDEHDDDITSLRNFCYLLTTEEWLELDDDFISYSDMLREEREKEGKSLKKIKKDEEEDDDSFFFVVGKK